MTAPTDSTLQMYAVEETCSNRQRVSKCRFVMRPDEQNVCLSGRHSHSTACHPSFPFAKCSTFCSYLETHHTWQQLTPVSPTHTLIEQSDVQNCDRSVRFRKLSREARRVGTIREKRTFIRTEEDSGFYTHCLIYCKTEEYRLGG